MNSDKNLTFLYPDGGVVKRESCRNWEELLQKADASDSEIDDWENIIATDTFTEEGLVVSRQRDIGPTTAA